MRTTSLNTAVCGMSHSDFNVNYGMLKKIPALSPEYFSVQLPNELLASVVTALSVNVSKKGLEKIWTEISSHLPH